ncbi:MAG TPA: hypothetical protein VGV40_04845 [Solirubrobacteraceae bacterium]|nr:hypothetical protein [Solirubrobacteraceae bacterium]
MFNRSRAIAAILAASASVAVAVPAVAQPQGGKQVNFGRVISALNNINVQLDRLNALNDLTVEDVQVVNIEDSLNNNRVRALNNALRNADIDVVRNSLNNNDIIKNVLNNNDVDIDDVVAISVLDDGRVLIFVRDVV